MHTDTPAYGLWSLVVINSAVFIIFAFSFTHPRTARDWRSFGAFAAFLVALFTVWNRPSNYVLWVRHPDLAGAACAGGGTVCASACVKRCVEQVPQLLRAGTWQHDGPLWGMREDGMMGRGPRAQSLIQGTRSRRSGTINAYTVVSHRGGELVRAQP
jgi:hypothetical protein